MESPKSRIQLQLVLDSLPSPGKIPNILRVHYPKLRSGSQEDITNELNEGSFFSLADVEFLQNTTIGFSEIEDISEYDVDETV